MGGLGALGSALSAFAKVRGARNERQQKRKDTETIEDLQDSIEARNPEFEGPTRAQGRTEPSGSVFKRLGRVIGIGKHGGRVERSGLYQLHRGEIVVPSRMLKPGSKRKTNRASGRR